MDDLGAPGVVRARGANEASWGKANGFLLVRVTGPYRGDAADQRDDNHASERFVDELPADLEYANTGSLADMREWLSTVLLPACRRRERVSVCALPSSDE